MWKRIKTWWLKRKLWKTAEEARRTNDCMVACLICKQVYLTEEAWEDPSIQKNITCCKNGFSCKHNNDCVGG